MTSSSSDAPNVNPNAVTDQPNIEKGEGSNLLTPAKEGKNPTSSLSYNEATKVELPETDVLTGTKESILTKLKNNKCGWAKLTPNQKRMVKVAAVIVAIAAVIGLGLLAMHFTVGIHTGFQAAGHWMGNTALPALKTLLAQHINVAQGLAYIGAPIVGGALMIVAIVMLVKCLNAKRKAQAVEETLEIKEDSTDEKIGNGCFSMKLPNLFKDVKNPLAGVGDKIKGFCKSENKLVAPNLKENNDTLMKEEE